MKTVLIALKNLNRQKRRTFLLGGAIAFGIMVVSLINGFTGSFVENVRENFSQLLAGHIFVEGVEKTAEGTELSIIRDDTVLLETLAEIDVPVRFVTKRSQFNGSIIFQGEQVRQNITGINWSEEEFIRERLVLAEGSFENLLERNQAGNRDGIIISQEIADRLNVQLGERVIVRLQTVTGQQNVGDFVVAAISYDPGIFGAISAYADLAYVNELLTLGPEEYNTLGILLEDIERIDEGVQEYYNALQGRVELFERTTTEEGVNPVQALFEQADTEQWDGTRYRVYTLNDALSEMQQIVFVLNTTGFVILLVLLAIIMVGITNTFRMIMYERIKEIGTMRALGMQKSGVRRLFLLEAFFLALGGVILGFAVAGVVMAIISSINLGVDSPLYLLLKNGRLTFKLLPWQMVMNVSVVALLTVLAAFFPSNKAANMKPVDALRA